MKKHLLRIAALLVLCSVFVGCQKDKTATIFGTVFDYGGSPVSNAEISLWRTDNVITSTVTGSDGQYEMSFDNKSGEYYLQIIYRGKQYFYNHITFSDGEIKRFDIRLSSY